MRSLYENSRGRGSEVKGIEGGKEGQKLVVQDNGVVGGEAAENPCAPPIDLHSLSPP